MTSERPLGFGICGLGFMGRHYFVHLRKHPHARVVTVCDQNPERRAGNWDDAIGNINVREGERLDMSGINAQANWEAVVADKQVDVVAITLPTPTHADVTVRALEAGKHVLCEKPMALTLAECDRMIAAAERTGRTLMIAQCIRFWPQYELIKQYVDQGRVGAVRFVSLRRLSSPPGHSAGGWMMDASQSGGVLFDLHVHDIDYAQHLLGMPATLSAQGWRRPSGRIDHVVATYTYSDGRCASLEGAWSYSEPWPFEMAITVLGETGTLDWSLRQGPEVHLYHGGTGPETIAVSDETGWARELDYFIDCLREGRTVERCLPTSSRMSIALALLERESIERGGASVAVGG